MREQGVLALSPVPGRVLEASQPSLMSVRGSTWGRLLALRIAGAGVPRYIGIPTFQFWLTRLSFKQKVQSIVGTFRRVARKRLRANIELVPRDDD
jgi:coenzyme F420 hydrogenase subunit beta